MSAHFENTADIRAYADRIEAVTKRETVTNCNGLNAAKMREALELVAHMNDDGYWNGSASICNLVAKANAALSAPPRNCDVGTAEEQSKRFKSYCNSKVCKRNVCHSFGYEELFHHECFPIWAQMPYDEVGTK